MKKTFLLVIVLIAIFSSIWYLQQPDTITVTEPNAETSETTETVEITLGPLGERQSVEVGEKLQDFLLVDYDENTHQLSEYQGTPLLLNFWASWCPFCIDEMPLFEEVYADFKAKGGEIIAINRGESEERARQFTDPMNLSYPLLLNKADDVYRAYQLQGMPVTFFITADGTIQHIKRGPIQEEELVTRLNQLVEEKTKVTKEESTTTDEKPTEIPTANAAEKEKTPSQVTTSSRPITTTDDIKHSVPLKDIKGGGPPKDGIPSIDRPQFTSISEADEFLDDEGLGIAVSYDDVNRYYPFQILVWHEIVNDTINGKRILVTYCPLCGTGIVFDPIVQGEGVEFGTSGKLWNSNLIMYDRKTDTYWSQVLGEAILGELTGQKLKLLPYDNLRWKDWKKAHPNGEVLSKNTGHFRNYSSGGPYGDYDTNTSIYFPVDHSDDRYHVKEPTFGIELNGLTKVYPQSELQKSSGNFTDQLGGTVLNVSFDKQDNTITITRQDTGEEVVPFYGFWFSWISVHPDSEVYVSP